MTQCAEVIREEPEALEKEMPQVLTETVVDNFGNPKGTLNSLIQATLSLLGIKNETLREPSDMIIGDINWESTQPKKSLLYSFCDSYIFFVIVSTMHCIDSPEREEYYSMVCEAYTVVATFLRTNLRLQNDQLPSFHWSWGERLRQNRYKNNVALCRVTLLTGQVIEIEKSNAIAISLVFVLL